MISVLKQLLNHYHQALRH